MINISSLRNGLFSSITYILPVGDTRYCWLVDCGDVEKVIEQGWRVRGVLLTHAHFDHIYGLNRLMEVFPDAWVFTNEAGAEGLQNPKWNFSRYHQEVDNFVFLKPENVRVIEGEGRISLLSTEGAARVVPSLFEHCRVASKEGDSHPRGALVLSAVEVTLRLNLLAFGMRWRHCLLRGMSLRA